MNIAIEQTTEADIDNMIIDILNEYFINGVFADSVTISTEIKIPQYIVILRLARLMCTGKVKMVGRKTNKSGYITPHYIVVH